MICPLKTLAATIPNSNYYNLNNKCDQTECAWWSYYYCCCSIAAIVNALFDSKKL